MAYIPPTENQEKIAQAVFGKRFEDLTINQRTKIRQGKIKPSSVSYSQYLEDYKKMAEDPNYTPKYVKAATSVGIPPEQSRARMEAKKTIEGFNEKLQRNISKRKREKLKTALQEDPKRKQEAMAKKAERRRQRRTARLEDKKSLTPREKFLNFQQSLIARQLNDKIKANPDLILKNEKLMDDLSTTISKDGDIIKVKPNLSEIKNRGIYEIEHQRDIRKKGAMKDFPYNRNLILGPHNRTGGFKDAAEKFIEKNPNSPKVQNILNKANELKITLQPNVPEGTFPTKGLGYKQISNPVEKFKDVAVKITPELVDNKLGIAGYTKDLNFAKKALGMKKLTLPAIAVLTGYQMFKGDEVQAQEPTLKYNPDLGAFTEEKDVKGVTAQTKVDQSDLLSWAKENPMTATTGGVTGAAAVGTKAGRALTGKMVRNVLSALGSPTAALGFYASDVASDIEEGKSAEDIILDPAKSLNLLYPELAKRTGAKFGIGALSRFALNPLNVGRVLTPVGLALTGAGLAYQGGKDIVQEYQRRQALTPEERMLEDTEYQAQLDEQMVGP